jgi:Fe-S-cluster containining protein
MWKGPIYDCQKCGACCTDFEHDHSVGYVWLTKDESKQMRRLGLTVSSIDGICFLGTRDREGASNPTCVALSGRVGGPCRCAIYQVRPLNCRHFEVGGRYCKSAREQAGLPV